MTLTEAQIERWSRQIILPEVGGRGQARLLAATASVEGTSGAARFAAERLGRAGVDTTGAAPADVVLDFSGDPAALVARGRLARDARLPFVVVLAGAEAADVATLVGRPCVDCLPLAVAAGEPDAPLALALGALAAAEALRVLLAPPASGRIQTLDLRTGGLVGRDLDVQGCAGCGAASS
jgi:hypothetical protein